MLTQNDRVMRALQKSGAVGITQGDFLLPHICDDGAPITRVGARIKDLRNMGYSIRTAGTRNGFAVYVLVESWVGEADWNWPQPKPPATANTMPV